MANTYIRIGIGIAGSGSGDTFKVKVSTDDTTSAFLEDKINLGSDKLTKEIENPGQSERVILDVDQTKIDHDQLLNFEETEHKSLDDAQTSVDTLWSSQKIQNELDTKVDKASSTDNAIAKFDGVDGDLQDSGVLIDDSNNVTGVNDLTIEGDLLVKGETTTINTATLDVEDANITVNKGGDDVTAEGSGLTVERAGTDGSLVYDSSLSSKFKAGDVGAESEILTKDASQDVLNKTIDATSATGTNSISMDAVDVVVDNSTSGIQSTDVQGALQDINERDLFNKYHLYEDNALAFADGEPGVVDPSGLDRDGWYYENLNAGEKINWYYFDGSTQGTVTLGEISGYSVMTFDSIDSVPLLVVYTFPTGTNDLIPGFAHSRAVYDDVTIPTPVVGTKYLVYFGQNPNIHPELPRIELPYSTLSSAGDLDPSEVVFTIAFASNSVEPVGDVKYMVEELGIYSEPVKHRVELRIKSATDSDLQTHINNSTDAHDASAISFDNSTNGFAATNAQDAIEEAKNEVGSSVQEIYDVTNEPTGFPNRTDSVVTFDDGTASLTIAPTGASFDIYIKGKKFTKTVAESVALNTSEPENHYFYYDNTGTLQATHVFFPEIFSENAIVAVVYWNTDIQEHVYFAEERHGLQMDGATHGYLHTTFGARYISGLALENFDEVTFIPGLNVDQGSIRDEDLLLQIPLSNTVDIGIMYRIGTQWKKVTGLSYPLLYVNATSDYTSGGLPRTERIPYNNFDGVSWSLEDPGSDNVFVLVHYFATNDKENPIVAIQGTGFYNNVPDAKNAAASEIQNLTGLPFLEFVAIGTVVYKTSESFALPTYAEYVPIEPGVNYVDFRGTQQYTPAGTATSHSILSGLANDDHFQYHTDERADTWYQNKFPLKILEQDVTFLDAQTDVNSGIVLTNDMQAVNIEIAIERGTDIEYLQVEAVRTAGSLDWAVSTTSLGSNSGVSIDVIGNDIKYTSTSTGTNALARIKVNGIGYNIS